MFTGIVEALGRVERLSFDKGNQVLQVSSVLAAELNPGQSLAHNGVCLSVEGINNSRNESSSHQVSIITETLKKTALGALKEGDRLNLERSLALGERLEGHFVQGHIDTAGTLEKIVKKAGSQEFFIRYPVACANLIIPQGSITLNGISLTIASIQAELFSVCIIPHTHAKTNVSDWKEGSAVNIEFDVLGKYIQKIVKAPKEF